MNVIAETQPDAADCLSFVRDRKICLRPSLDREIEKCLCILQRIRMGKNIPEIFPYLSIVSIALQGIGILLRQEANRAGPQVQA
jgi:hypothetical protein